MMTSNLMSAAWQNDSELVGESLSGNRDAFGCIVSRYQSLVCSLAYSATGSLGQSEDLAQETFIVAWKRLGHLRERDKLRSWLCGIARNRINNFLRREGREPIQGAEPLEVVAESHSPDPLPVDRVITQEEQAILWRSLELVPLIYREPLVLFYREQQSIETVAAALELSEDAVKQRLSRGRKLLQEQVLAFVEGALEKTRPGRAFTVAVVAALPLAVVSGKAATVGATVAKGSAAAKGMLSLGLFGSLLALLGGLYLTLRSQVDNTKSPRERQFIRQMIGLRIVATLLLVGVYLGGSRFTGSLTSLAQNTLKAAFLFVLAVSGAFFFAHINRRQRQIQMQEGTWVAAEWEKPRRETEPVAGLDGPVSKWNRWLRPAKSMAFALVCCVIVTADMLHSRAWKEIWTPILVLAACLGLAVRNWWQHPRFHTPQLGWQIAFPVVMAALTLIQGNLALLSPYADSTTFADVHLSLPVALLLFNGSVVLAYGVFLTLLVRFIRQRGQIKN